jgi:3-dehydroquinate synthase
MTKLSVKSHRGYYKVEFSRLEDIPAFENSIAVVDSAVYSIYGPSLESKFDHVYKFEASEEYKTLDFCYQLIDTLRSLGVKKDTKLVAVGGGITQDVTSFVASILYRGIDWYFIPTTLLAQADSCIGSKTSINHRGVKNLVGSFYPPKGVWCDVNFLKSLDDSDIDSGVGEILHYYMLYDTSLAKSIDKDDIEPSIYQSLSIKRTLIESDEFDQGTRRLYNYGHTFGHAIESLTNYSIKHGLAVTLGMHIANYVSHRLGYISKEDLDYLQGCVEFNLPDYKLKDCSKYIKELLKDKKNIGSSLVCILPTERVYDLVNDFYAFPHSKFRFEVVSISDLALLESILGDYINDQ